MRILNTVQFVILNIVQFAALGALAGGCSWTFEDDGGWLPLRGAPPSLDTMPEVASHFVGAYDHYRGPDGRIWVPDLETGPEGPNFTAGLLLDSLEANSTRLHFPPGAQLTLDGVISARPVDGPPATRFRVELDRLGAGPTIAREGALPTSSTSRPFLNASRGPGYFVVAVPDDSATTLGTTTLQVLFDDGHDDTIPTGDEHWHLINDYGDSFAPQVYYGSSRYVLLLKDHNNENQTIGVYDLQTREVRSLVDFHLVVTPPGPQSHPSPRPFLYDSTQERIWTCGAQTATVAVATGERIDLPFDCIDVRFTPGHELMIQASDGSVYAVPADGSAWTLVDKLPPYSIAAVHDRLIVHSPGELGDGAYQGWLGAARVIEAGVGARFSADGRRLRWLEDAASGVGDLYSLDLASRMVRHLVRNVRQFDELPDGRLVALSNAASDGAWNRAVLVDEDAGECRWLAKGVQTVGVVGDGAVATRMSGSMLLSYLLAVPPLGAR
jgi:hypothetical protein